MEGTTPERFRANGLSVDEHTSLYGGFDVDRTEGVIQLPGQERLRLVDQYPKTEMRALSHDCGEDHDIPAGEVGLKMIAEGEDGVMTEVAGYFTPAQAEELGKKMLEAAEIAGGDHAAAYGDE